VINHFLKKKRDEYSQVRVRVSFTFASKTLDEREMSTPPDLFIVVAAKEWQAHVVTVSDAVN